MTEDIWRLRTYLFVSKDIYLRVLSFTQTHTRYHHRHHHHHDYHYHRHYHRRRRHYFRPIVITTIIF